MVGLMGANFYLQSPGGATHLY